MKRPKMNAWERFLYRKEALTGLYAYCRIRFAFLFREMGIYRFQMWIRDKIESLFGIEVMFKSELPAKPVLPSERATLKVYNGENIL